MGNCCGRGNLSTLVEMFFYLSDDKRFIAFLETNYFVLKNDGKRDFSRINDHINLNGDTLLHYAVFNNRIELCKYLIKNGSDFKLENDRKRTSLDLAMKKSEILDLMKN